jgi:hypothetical protein
MKIEPGLLPMAAEMTRLIIAAYLHQVQTHQALGELFGQAYAELQAAQDRLCPKTAQTVLHTLTQTPGL